MSAGHRRPPVNGNAARGTVLLFRPRRALDLEPLEWGPGSGSISDEALWGQVLGDVPAAARGDAGRALAVIARPGHVISPYELAGDGDLADAAPALTPAAVTGADLAHDLFEGCTDREDPVAVYRQLLPFLAGSAGPCEQQELLTAFAITARQMANEGLRNGRAGSLSH